VRSFLSAALLHDLGHFPYTHSLKELPLREHESLTGDLICSEPVKSFVSAAGGDPQLAAAIVDRNLPGAGRELLFFRKLLSGALDPDKLDYLNRDAHCCGVPYGAQDVDFIFSRLLPHQERGVDIDSRGIPSVESLLFSKYLMYRTVYWHRSVRAATAMIKKALLGGLESGVIAREELYNLDDEELFSLMRSRKHPLFALAESVRNGTLYTTAAELPFDEKCHRKLLPLQDRSRLEAALAKELSPFLGKPLAGEELIIDLPEPVTFETGLYVRDEMKFFPQSSSAFTGALVDTFARSLRVIRIFISPCRLAPREEAPETLDQPEIPPEKEREGILHITQKWLQL
jgi:HD superfamily phosphohydrolase